MLRRNNVNKVLNNKTMKPEDKIVEINDTILAVRDHRTGIIHFIDLFNREDRELLFDTINERDVEKVQSMETSLSSQRQRQIQGKFSESYSPNYIDYCGDNRECIAILKSKTLSDDTYITRMFKERLDYFRHLCTQELGQDKYHVFSIDYEFMDTFTENANAHYLIELHAKSVVTYLVIASIRPVKFVLSAIPELFQDYLQTSEFENKGLLLPDVDIETDTSVKDTGKRKK